VVTSCKHGYAQVNWQDLQFYEHAPVSGGEQQASSGSGAINVSSIGEEGQEHFLHPGGHRLVFVPSGPGENWFCDRCSFENDPSNANVPRYRCHACDFDLCQRCWNRTPEPRNASEIVARASGRSNQGASSQREPEPPLLHVALFLNYGVTGDDGLHLVKVPSKLPGGHTFARSDSNSMSRSSSSNTLCSSSGEPHDELHLSELVLGTLGHWQCLDCSARNALSAKVCGGCYSFNEPEGAAADSAQATMAAGSALNSPGGLSRESSEDSGGGDGGNDEHSSSVLTVTLSERNAVVLSSTWRLRLKSGKPGAFEPTYFSCWVNGVKVGVVCVPSEPSDNDGTESAGDGHFNVERSFRHPSGVSQGLSDTLEVTLELQRVYGFHPHACDLQSGTVSLFGSSDATASSSSSSPSSSAMDLVVDPHEVSAQRSIEAFERLLENGAATRAAQATRLLSDDPLGSMLADAGAGLVHLEVTIIT